MKVHQWAVETSSNEVVLQLIKKYRSSWPGISTFSLTECFPLGFQSLVVVQHKVLGVLAEKHLTDDGFSPPETTCLIQIDTIQPTRVCVEGIQQNIDFFLGGKKHIDQNISKKSDNSFPTTTSTRIAREAFFRAEISKVRLLKRCYSLSKSHVRSDSLFEPVQLR